MHSMQLKPVHMIIADSAKIPLVSQARLAHRVWYFTVSIFVLLSQLQGAVGKLSIFIVRGLLEIIA